MKEERKNNTEVVEYEDVKRLPIAAFLAIGFAFGVACGFSIGNVLPIPFIHGMALSIAVGILGGLILGLCNHCKKKQ